MLKKSFSGLLLVVACFSFSFPAAAQVLVHENGFNSSSVSPWEEYHPSETTADWSTTSSGSNPSCSPHEGSRMAEFDSYYSDSGDEARIESPGLNMTGAEVAECTFWMYHDTGDSSRNDYIKFQLSTDGGDHYYTKHQFYRYDGSNGWRQEVVPLGYYTSLSNLRIALRGYSRYGQNIFIDHVRITKDTLPAGAEGKTCSVPGDCDSGICGSDPGDNGRCRDDLAGHDCIDGHRMPVSAGTVTCYGGDVATCSGVDTWSVQDCYDDCGPYSDIHECEMGECVPCEEFCDPIFGTGCDEDAYCEFYPFFPLTACFYKGETGDACESNDQCISDNCVSSPSGSLFCEPASTPCAANDGSPVTAGTVMCIDGDLWTCQAGSGWYSTDCYTNCGFYVDVDDCVSGACVECATSCTNDDDCKPGILCQGDECVGDLPDGSTCTLDTQCESNHCVDGVCCADVCTLNCHRCDISGHEGTCYPVEAGQDPDGDCQGDGVCSGTCAGGGTACSYPGNSTICGECARCNGGGQCSIWVTAGSDPDDECPVCQVCSGTATGCAPVPDGEDPLEECDQQARETCGNNGFCDGNGACGFWVEGTECGIGSCSNGNAVFPDTCDGAGQCTDGGSGSCGFYRCADATSCAESCTTHSICTAVAFCNTQGECAPDLGEGVSCEDIVYPGQIDDAACMGGYCFDDNFDGQGAFCTSDPAACVHDGVTFSSGYALCQEDQWYRVCQGGATGWGPEISCAAGTCDAGGGDGSGYREAGGCANGPGGGCTATCVSCEPYMAESASACRQSCSLADHCWPGYACQGNECKVPEGIGDPCQEQADCQVGVCTDGVCCNDACQGPCRACNLPGHEGFCTLAEEGSDPDEDCDEQSQESCATTGACDGHGNCALWSTGTVCGEPHCEGNTLMGGATCNGAGDCLQEQDTDCRPGRCEGDACIQSCSSHDACDPAGFCAAGGTCQLDLEDGASCEEVVRSGLERDPACLGGFCYDDTFNETGAFCTSDETACVADGKTYQPGYRLCQDDEWYRICLGGEAGFGGETICLDATYCDAGGGPASGVMPAQTCTSGMLGGCAAQCLTCFPYMAREPGVCTESCDESADCWPGYTCSEGTCQALPGLGESCTSDSDCDGWTCVDGVCCNEPCDGPCRVCDDPDFLGTCIFVREGVDPSDDCEDDEEICGHDGLCDGLGACAFAPAGTECEPASCEAGVFTGPSTCDGRGNCVPGHSHECESGSCDGDCCAVVQVDGGADGGDGGIPDGGDGYGEPIAEAGPVQLVSPGTLVTLDGSSSRGVNLTYLWEQSSGPGQVSLTGSTTPRPSFTAADEGVYVFRLVVSDDERDSQPDFTEIHAVKGAGGCSCASRSPSAWAGLLVLLPLFLLRRKAR